MGIKKLLLPRYLCALLVLPLAGWAAPQKNVSLNLTNIKVKNFGRINDNYYRGAQPKEGDYRTLAALGVKTVIDLTKDGRDDEPSLVRNAGMKFYRIPMTTSDRPADSAVTKFLQLVNDPANQPVFVHCQGGRHRTGVMTAVYRMTQDGWTANQAYSEMKKYKFETLLGHPELKDFVYDYHAKLSRARLAEARETTKEAGVAK